MLADAEFDSERNHTYIRRQLGAQSVIPAKRGKKTWRIHGVRAEMPSNLPSRKPDQSKAPSPPARCLARLPRYYGPLGLPPSSEHFQPSDVICSVFAQLGCQVGSLLFRAVLSQRATA